MAAGYRELAARFPDRIAIVSGDGSVDEVHARVVALVEALA